MQENFGHYSVLLSETVDGLDIKENGIYLLEGVTGSGKSEVYLNLAKHYLSLNKTVIIFNKSEFARKERKIN